MRITYNVERRTVKTASYEPAVIRNTNPVLLQTEFGLC